MIITKTIEAVKRLHDGCVAMRLTCTGPDDRLIYFIAQPVEMDIRPGDTVSIELSGKANRRFPGKPARRFRYNDGPWIPAKPGQQCQADGHFRSEIADITERQQGVA